MGSVWLTIPSKRPPEQAEPVLKLWRERWYKIALYLDSWEEVESRKGTYDTAMSPTDEKYPGYAIAVNSLIEHVRFIDREAEWFVCAGDDTEPDPNHSAEEIAQQCRNHFALENDRRHGNLEQLATFGVMQPTGDRWGEDRNSHAFDPVTPGCDSCRCRQCGQGPDAPRHMVGAYIDRVCGSPWIGREFARRMYRGNGPYHPEYTHMGVDEELQHVAIKMGVLWQRPDLTHFHRHWGRGVGGAQYGNADNMPEFLKAANTPEHWYAYKRVFDERKRLEFPGHEPVA